MLAFYRNVAHHAALEEEGVLKRIMIGKTMFLYFVALFFMFLTKRTVDSVQLSVPPEVTGTYSGSVMVSCQYDLQFKDNTKYWCKGPVYDICVIVVKTPRNRPNKRSFIVDDKDAGIFTVTMTALGDSDEDTYWCVISRSGRNVYTAVKLIISPAGMLQLRFLYITYIIYLTLTDLLLS